MEDTDPNSEDFIDIINGALHDETDCMSSLGNSTRTDFRDTQTYLIFGNADGSLACGKDDGTAPYVLGYGSVIHELLHAIGMLQY